MRDTRESRLLLILLVAVAFALITVDIHGGDDSPLNGPRSAAASLFGPVESGVSRVVSPVADGLHALRNSGSQADRIRQLEQQNELLRQQLSSNDLVKSRDGQLSKLLGLAGAGQYTIKVAQVVAIGSSQNFSWTVTIDIGSNDGILRDMTVINGDGLVGRVTTVAPTTSTVLLAVDPRFTVGARLESSGEVGFGTGEGDAPMRVELLNGHANAKVGGRLVTFGSEKDKPFVPGVPFGTITQIVNTPGELTKTVLVQPFVSFTKLDLVGVVVQPPPTDPRFAVLPPKPAPPAPSSTPSPSTPASATPSGAATKKR
ncbi:rod shape-determining protein MreC [Streptacidiphilus neutrinimicus]|uniref:rod shape-determining protein MreC n=1 Tax=Streptacidiphilus neutrinimicus TaxID=105420 RepID=UPI0005A9C253|nr:rod shape-determining protein MreC [Streptacidiphilus neutrinimicus]